MEGLLAGRHQLFIDPLEFLFLIFSPDKGLDRPNGGKSLLHHVIEAVHRLLQAAVHGSHLADHPDEDHRQNRGAHDKHQRELRVHPEGEPQAHQEHHRTANQRTQSAVDGVLQHGHVGGHAGDERGAVEMVQIGKGVLLHLFILGLPDARAPAVGGAGGKPGVQQAGGQRKQGAQSHQRALRQDMADVAVRHANVDEVGHQHGDDQLKRGFHQHQQRPDQQVPAIGSQIAQKRF